MKYSSKKSIVIEFQHKCRIDYVKEKLGAKRIDLGVFENNESAKRCYEAVGFKEYSVRDCELPIGNWKCIDMEMFI